MRPPSLDPMLARISGLPGETVGRFSSDLCRTWLAAGESLAQDLTAVRAELVERLYKLIPQAPPELRPFLLAVKRDAFNGRPLAHGRETPRWDELVRRAGPVVDRLVTLEARQDDWSAGFAAAYELEREREHSELLSLLADAGFRRGLALASPVLAEAAERARRSGTGLASGRREARLDLSLLRYASRAALKLSPFSTLTRVAVGAVDPEASQPLTWAGDRWHERSLVRLQRSRVEQGLEMLLRYRPLREGLRVSLNPTLAEISPERYRFFRPERWALDARDGQPRQEPASLAEMELPSHFTSGVFRVLREGPLAYGCLRDVLAAELGGPEGAEMALNALDALIAAGVLLLDLPWPGNEPWLEKALLAHLRTLPTSPGLEAVLTPLDHLVSLEAGFSRTADPLRAISEMLSARDAWLRSAAALAEIELAGGPPVETRGEICEDVLLEPENPGTSGVLRVSGNAVREILRSAEPWAQLTAFQGFRLDFLHTVAAFLESRWPGRQEVGFLELFTAAQPLWREYRKLLSSGRGAWQAAFNPLGLPEISALARLRAGLWEELRARVRSLPAGAPLPLTVLEEITARIPRHYTLPLGPCLFVQPADSVGSFWVLNRIFEGTGRYGSRFTPAMDEETRQRYTGRFVRASRLAWDGAPADLVDLPWSRRDLLNVHAVQTARVLTIPGEAPDRQTAESLNLHEVRVILDGAGSLPRLVDATGRRLIPVHLGGTACGLMPFLVQFLAQWGPGEIRPLPSPMPHRREGDLQVMDRLTTGCLVLHRRRWVVAPDAGLHGALAEEASAFAAVNRWRLRQNLPERLFWIERVRYRMSREAYKPQYLDFTSPLFVEVLRSALRNNRDLLTFEELLPAPEDFSRGPEQGRWCVELQLDTLALEHGIDVFRLRRETL